LDGSDVSLVDIAKWMFIFGSFVIVRGGLAIIINGHNFDSIYGYFGNPFVPLTEWPYIGIWVGGRIGPIEFVDTVS